MAHSCGQKDDSEHREFGYSQNWRAKSGLFHKSCSCLSIASRGACKGFIFCQVSFCCDLANCSIWTGLNKCGISRLRGDRNTFGIQKLVVFSTDVIIYTYFV